VKVQGFRGSGGSGFNVGKGQTMKKISSIFPSGLILGFTCVVFLFFALGTASFIELRSLSDIIRTIYDHPLVVSNASLSASTSITKMHRDMKDVVLFKFSPAINSAIISVDEQERLVYKNLDLIKSQIIGPEGKSLENETRQLFIDWQPIRKEVIALARTGERETAAGITMGKGADHVRKLESKMSDLTAYARNKADRFLAHSERVRTRVTRTSIIFMLAGTFLLALIAFLTVRGRREVEKKLTEAVDRERLFADIVRDSSVSIATGFPDGRLGISNHAFQKLTGYNEEELKQINWNEVLTPPEWREHEAAILGGLDQAKPSVSFEKEYIRKDGSRVPIDITVYARFDHEGSVVSLVGFVMDITERKEAEGKIKAALKEKETLLKEIHHRVKNNMNVTSSLLKLQSADITDKKTLQLFKDTRGRIETMALVHDKLYRSKDLAHIDFREYIKDLAENQFRSYGVKRDRISLKVAAEELFFEIDLATPCGLMISELVSNALKHAFPQNRKGEIKIALSAIDGHEFELIVSDDGVGIPADVDFENSESFGLYLVRLLVEQLDGTVDLGRDGGTTFRIRFRK